ncbi:hypothetical protein QH494_04425 [Sphingomonas sp. AR_OL41]|jgi:uncharacterized protein YcfJ|uniref:hypothetical protein n=1 Tax=Sphingomonas sp. AR_OL41 TaxID=3042729 RepID=UPI002481222F|nr:hypothetical protein [Sphingomonas sp. AR_OL41]MDH7971417.1 hypothetical protein [Sphingomonas sp. AR_OL41]
MRKLIMALSAVSLVIPAMAIPTAAEAKRHYYNGHTYKRTKVCRHSSGTTGLVAGGVGGALVGNSVFGHGALGTIAGGVGGAFAGRAIDRTITAKKRCYYR